MKSAILIALILTGFSAGAETTSQCIAAAVGNTFLFPAAQEFQFRDFTRDDVDRVTQFILSVRRGRNWSESTTADGKGMFEDFRTPELYLNPRGRFFIAETEDGKIVGTVGFYVVNPWIFSKYTDCELKKLYVDETYKGRKLGKQLVQMVLKAAEELSCGTISLQTDSEMKTAIEIYKNAGFRYKSLATTNEGRTAYYYTKYLQKPSF